MTFDPETCTDCGSAPQWWYARVRELSYCRYCYTKNGYRPCVEVGVESVLEFLEGDEDRARAFFDKCGW